MREGEIFKVGRLKMTRDIRADIILYVTERFCFYHYFTVKPLDYYMCMCNICVCIYIIYVVYACQQNGETSLFFFFWTL